MREDGVAVAHLGTVHWFGLRNFAGVDGAALGVVAELRISQVEVVVIDRLVVPVGVVLGFHIDVLPLLVHLVDSGLANPADEGVVVQIAIADQVWSFDLRVDAQRFGDVSSVFHLSCFRIAFGVCRVAKGGWSVASVKGAGLNLVSKQELLLDPRLEFRYFMPGRVRLITFI